jgi:hypothetical protein
VLTCSAQIAPPKAWGMGDWGVEERKEGLGGRGMGLGVSRRAGRVRGKKGERKRGGSPGGVWKEGALRGIRLPHRPLEDESRLNRAERGRIRS